MKHSGLGIASFVIAIVAGIGMFSLVVVAGMQEASTPGGIDENSPAAALLGLLLIGCGLVQLVGVGLGIAGVVQKDRKKVFGILGICLNLAVIALVFALTAIGMAME